MFCWVYPGSGNLRSDEVSGCRPRRWLLPRGAWTHSHHVSSYGRLRTLLMSRSFEKGWRPVMLVRVFVLATGLIVMANAEASAANSPLAVEPQADDAQGQLFTPKQTSAPGDKPDPAQPLAKPAATGAELVPGGNPLWAIPIARLTATRDQPLFAPSRRPPPVAPAAAPVPPPVVQATKPPEPETPQLTLLGTVAGSGGRIGLFIDSASKAVVRLKYGESHKGWILRDVRPRQVELAKDLDNTVLDLPKPEATTGPARVPQAPAFAAASSPPGTAPLPVNTSASIGAVPSATPVGAPGMPPLKYSPPPALINPFPQPELRRQELRP